MIKFGSDFSGVGAANQALKRLGIKYKEIFACDIDKFARQTFIHNYGEPEYYPTDVYEREIPEEPLDLYVTSPPCQSFSLAGLRGGENDDRGVLFYNSHEFIKKNKPRFFVFENVKGLLSIEGGAIFGRWIDYLGGKSVNRVVTMFPHEESVPYHIYYQVLNAKDYGIPQNRERVFIVGIRDDEEIDFRFPKPRKLKKRLKDVLEKDVGEKYYLSDKLISGFISHNNRHRRKGNGFSFTPMNIDDTHSSALTARYNKMGATDPYLKVDVAGTLSGDKWDKQFEQSRRVYDDRGISPTIHTMGGGGQEPKIIESNYIGIGVHPNSKKLEFDGFKDRPSPALLATNYKAPKYVAFIEQRPRGANKGNRHKISPTITCNSWENNHHLHQDYRIRKLTPRECFRLMDFPDSFDFSVVSDSQAYKQAGNSVVVKMYELIFGELLK